MVETPTELLEAVVRGREDKRVDFWSSVKEEGVVLVVAVFAERELGGAWGNTAAILFCCEGLRGFCDPVDGAVCDGRRVEGTVEEGRGGAVCEGTRVEGTVEEEGGGAVCEGRRVEGRGGAVCEGTRVEGTVEEGGGGAVCGGRCVEGTVEEGGGG